MCIFKYQLCDHMLAGPKITWHMYYYAGVNPLVELHVNSNKHPTWNDPQFFLHIYFRKALATHSLYTV